MSKLRLTNTTRDARTFTYEGVEFSVLHAATIKRFLIRRLGLLDADGIEAKDFESLPPEARCAYNGRAMCGTIVSGFEPFTLEFEDGEPIDVAYEAPSDMDVYETQGEELLGQDEALQDALFDFALIADNFRIDNEARARKKF